MEARGHEVWFDKEEIKTGDEWRDKITRGILDSQQVVAFLSKHSVRDPGVCLNEIAIALADKGEAIVTVLVEPENEVKTPVSITHIQWLRMEDWAQQQANEEWYRNQLDKLVEAIEHPGHAGRNEELETLRLALDPMSFYAEIAPHIPGFTGRDWIINRYKQWLSEESNSRVLRIEGGPGLGKTAVSCYLAHSTKSSVLAVHLCQYNKGESRNPLRFIRTLAYQLATRLPDYRGRLLKSVAIQRPETMQGKDPASLWSDLISAQLAGSGDKAVIDRLRLAIIIDGLDEATVDGKNSIVELLATEINTLPKWIGVVLTGRPDPELTQRLARFQPLVLRDDDPANLADLKDYCDQWFDGELKSGKLNSAQAAAASETLLTQSQGAFLYLRQARIAAQEGMLDLTQPTTFPSGLTEIYQRFFERRFPEAWSDTGLYKSKVRPLLELILASPEPLPLSLAADILQWNEYDAPEVVRSLGSLIKRSKGGLVGENEETVAPFHNSIREWLRDADAAGDFFVSITESRIALTTAVWQRYLSHNEHDAYAWTVLPDLLPMLSHLQQDQLFGELTWETSQALYRLADSLAPKLRFGEAAATWLVQIRFGERLASNEPINTGFARNLSISYKKQGELQAILGNTQAALGYFEQSQKRLLAASPPHFEVSLENCDLQFFLVPENVVFAQELSISYERLGDMHIVLGNTMEAIDYFEKSLGIIWRLIYSGLDSVDFDLSLSTIEGKLGDLYAAQGRTDLALDCCMRHMDRLSELFAADSENAAVACAISTNYQKLGDLQATLGNIQDALEYFEQSQEIYARLFAATPENSDLARKLGTNYNRLGDLQATLGNTQVALEFFELSHGVFAQLFSAAPENAVFALDLSVSNNKLGDLQAILGNTLIALDYFKQSQEICARLFANETENTAFAHNLAISYDKQGDLQTALGNTLVALGYFEQSQKICAQLIAASPENVAFALEQSVRYTKLSDLQSTLGNTRLALSYSHKHSVSYVTLGGLEAIRGNTQAALGYFEQSHAICAGLIAAAPENVDFARELGEINIRLGDLQATLSNTQVAINYFEQSQEIYARLIVAYPENVDFARELGEIKIRLGDLQATLSNTQVAINYFEQSQEIYARLIAAYPENVDFARKLDESHIRLGDLQAILGNTQAALGYFEQNKEYCARLVAAAPGNDYFAHNLSVSYNKLGELHATLGNTPEALKYFEQAKDICARLFASSSGTARFARELCVSYGGLAENTQGKVQAYWWQQCYIQFKVMQDQGMLYDEDKPALDYVRQQAKLTRQE